MSLLKRCTAETLGTFWLVFGGCGSAIFAAAYPELGIGFAGVALAFGLTLLTMCYAIGNISGCHINPAVTLGLVAGGRFPAREAVPYIVAQVIGGILAGGVLYLIASGKTGFDPLAGFASNGFGEHSPGQLQPQRRLDCRDCADGLLPVHHHGCHTQTRPCWAGRCGDWPITDLDSPDQHPHHQHLGKPCPLYRRCLVPGHLGHRATVVVLGGPIDWRRYRCIGVSLSALQRRLSVTDHCT